jgi:alkanesulfonate monooxygenase SsuD/methylene tetrahydromethanopterin reductase-like flavin-dependent oxidoreductase (luciferase family)
MMEFGAIDHLDLSGVFPIGVHYENRLKLMEAYDEAGFFGIHVTEHHCTPLGGGASPSVFLSAAAQRTKRLRLGTLVYSLPTHHPIRIAEEIAMVDQMSGGRVDLGFGRGSVPMELAYFGIDPDDARAIFDEILACVLQGLGTGVIDFQGKFFQIDKAPILQRPVQQPHPPLWYGVHSVESAERAAREGFNIVCNEPPQDSRKYIDRFKAVWAQGRPGQPLPKIGLSRSVFVGRSDDEAFAVASRAHAEFQKSFRYLFNRHSRTPRLSGREANFEELPKGGRGIAGSPDTVTDFLCGQMEQAGANYCVMRMAFGDMSLDEMRRSVDLFADRVMPRLR